MLSKVEALEPLARDRGDAVVVTTMGAVRGWAELSDTDLDVASADSAMGHAADLALGIALARPERRVLCLNGDGSMLMSLGTLVMIAAQAPANLVLVVMDNGAYEITGGQPVPGAGVTDYAGLARAAGIAESHAFDDAAEWRRNVDDLLARPGPLFVALRVAPGEDGPLSRHPDHPQRMLRPSLAESARALRAALRGRDQSEA